MYNYSHIDEKWFYMSKKKETYYLLPTDENPLRSCQRKNFIGKVMFLVAMARPRFDCEGAQRRSRNRDVGTLEMKSITSVTREIVKDFLIQKVIPAIQQKWLRSRSEEVIFIQQDNARTHLNPNNEAFQVAATQSGLDIRLVCQPPNSPDMNILDLGVFNAIQSLQYKESPRSVRELVDAVIKSFNNYSSLSVNYVWLTLQLCMLETMKIQGSNRYKIPHINELQLEKEGTLPAQISCDPQIIRNVMDILS
ncbi:hypothetical protein LIER_07333 [Lithospermum erythrorhizon]|uniref:Transposase n=1 Tax=Lithospermum erythrorhizon TaxID=34254 RepID=A0AAV3PAC4_LITER